VGQGNRKEKNGGRKMQITITDQIDEAKKDLRNIKNRLYGAAKKYGNDSFGLEYENAAGYIDRAIKDISEARVAFKMAERERKKCEN